MEDMQFRGNADKDLKVDPNIAAAIIEAISACAVAILRAIAEYRS